MYAGARHVRVRTSSRRPASVARTALAGPSFGKEAKESVNGHCETTAAMLVVGRGERDHVPAGERRAEQRDAPTIDPRQRPGEGDRGAVVGVLTADVEQLTGLAPARAEVAIVEQEHAEPGGGKALSVRVEALVPGRREAVGHDHDRCRSGRLACRVVEPGGALHPV